MYIQNAWSSSVGAVESRVSIHREKLNNVCIWLIWDILVTASAGSSGRVSGGGSRKMRGGDSEECMSGRKILDGAAVVEGHPNVEVMLT